ncbi:MAG: hypothetical protein HDS67_03700 [Bacteroidales bacterium]|nr:hypothetical protein [Bacteroidales bacterium]
MKHNWEYKRLGEICSFIGGGTPSKANSAFYCGDIPWATVRDMADFKLSATELHITQDAIKQSATNLLPKGMIVISTHVGLGKICELMQDTAINQDLKGVSFNQCSVNKHYFVQWYRSIADYIIANGRGATVKGVTLDFIKNLSIPVPPMETQEKIVAELDQINDLIAKNRELVSQLDVLAQSLFYDTFGDPITNPKGFSKTSLKEVSTVKIGPFGSLLHKEDYISGGTPLVNPIHMQDGYVVADNDFTIDDNKKETLSSYVLKRNDIVFGRRGDIGRCALITGNEDGYLCGTGSLFVRFIIPINSLYALWCFKQPTITKYLIERAKGATMLNINCGIVESVPLILPPIALQEEFATKVEAIEAQKAKVEAEIAELQTLLDARMDYWFN